MIKKMLRFHPQALYFGILGLMVGSIIIIWPDFDVDSQGMIAASGLVAFALIAHLFSNRK